MWMRSLLQITLWKQHLHLVLNVMHACVVCLLWQFDFPWCLAKLVGLIMHVHDLNFMVKVVSYFVPKFSIKKASTLCVSFFVYPKYFKGLSFQVLSTNPKPFTKVSTFQNKELILQISDFFIFLLNKHHHFVASSSIYYQGEFFLKLVSLSDVVMT